MLRIDTPRAWREARATGDRLAERNAILAEVPPAWRKRALKRHDKLGGIWSADANRWLYDMQDRVRGLRVPLDASDADLIALADKLAREAINLASGPVVFSADQFRARLAKFCACYAVVPPSDTVSDTGAIKRMTDAIWWRRGLRKAQGRAIEGEAIRLGYVHKRAEVYASDVTVERRARQKARNASVLVDTQAINLDTGELLTLAELAERSNACPKIRRGELMTRIAGFEAVAQGLGHVGLFLTVTAPSRFHAKKQVAGRVVDNPKYGGETPRAAQSYLTRMWARARAALHRLGVRPYGFRIAEPHHDGTPHWHMLLFVAATAKAALCGVVAKYARAEDAHEMASKEAQEARFLAKEIDPAKGTAAGYIAKYVSKNIDGYQVQGDMESGMDAVTSSQRVEAWASTWGIRQFQQIGGAPVGVWRELRRLREPKDEYGEDMEAGRAAADAGNWRRYVEVQGGPTVPRECLRLRVASTRKGERYDVRRGEVFPAPLNRYGEIAPGAVFGVREVVRDRAHVSRFHRWEIRRGGVGRLASAGRLQAGEFRQSGPASCGFQAVEDGPWTRVNNCTGGVGDERAGNDGSIAGGSVAGDEIRNRPEFEGGGGGFGAFGLAPVDHGAGGFDGGYVGSIGKTH